MCMYHYYRINSGAKGHRHHRMGNWRYQNPNCPVYHKVPLGYRSINSYIIPFYNIEKITLTESLKCEKIAFKPYNNLPMKCWYNINTLLEAQQVYNYLPSNQQVSSLVSMGWRWCFLPLTKPRLVRRVHIALFICPLYISFNQDFKNNILNQNKYMRVFRFNPTVPKTRKNCRKTLILIYFAR